MQRILTPACGSITQRSVLIQPCDLRLITTENIDVECVAFKLVNMCSGKKLPEDWTVKTFCCVVVEALTWFTNGVKLKTSMEAVKCTRFVLGAILFTNGDKKKGLAHWQLCFQLL